MHFFFSNLKLLRTVNAYSQQTLADHLRVSRANIAKYEGGVHEPSFEVLIRTSRLFNISIDKILLEPLRKEDLEKGKQFNDSTFKVLPIQVDQEGNDIIEVVSHSAKAGYKGMYSDPGFIGDLDNMSIPFIKTSNKCRAFPISGDSMPPFDNDCFAIGEYITSFDESKSGERYIVLTRDEGILFKRLKKKDKLVELHSDNPKYPPISIHKSQILELWKFIGAVTSNEIGNDRQLSDIALRLEVMKSELSAITESLGSPTF